jgi:GntR family transcriptional regulator
MSYGARQFHPTTYTILERHVVVPLKGASDRIHATKADRDDAAFLGLEGDPILLLDRVTFAEDGRPVERSIFHYYWNARSSPIL